MAIRCCSNLAIFGFEDVVVFTASQFRTAEADAVFDAQDSWQAEQCFGEVGFDLVEDRFTKSRRNAGGHDFRNTADGIGVSSHSVDDIDHFCSGIIVGTTNDVRRTVRELFDLFQRHVFRLRDVGLHAADLTHVADHLSAEFACDQLLRDDSSSHASRGFASTAATATTVVSKAIPSVVGVVRVSRTVFVFDVRIVFTALVCVPHENGDAGSRGMTFKDSGQDFWFIGFLPLSRQFTLTWTSAIQIEHQIFDGNGDSGRNSINDHHISGAVTFAGRCDAEELSKRIAWHCFAEFTGHRKKASPPLYRQSSANNMLQRYILLWLLTSSGIAYFWPMLGLTTDPFTLCGGSAINVLIVITMFGVGALLPIQEVNNIFARWSTVFAGTAIQYLSMPFLAWLIVFLTRPDPETAAGILIVGCVPGAMASNVLTLAARGNVSYSVSLTTSATMLSPIIVPIAMSLTFDKEIAFDGWSAVRLMLFQVVLPVVIGHLLSRFDGAFRKYAEQYASTIANLSILAIIAIAVALNRSGVAQASGGLLCVLALLNLGGYLAGYFGGAAFRLDEPMRRALTLEVGMQNAGAAARGRSIFRSLHSQ